MNDIWLIIIAVSAAVAAGCIVSLVIEARKTLRSLNDLMKTTEETLKPTIKELQETLCNLKIVSGDITEVTADLKVLSGSVRDVGVNVKLVSELVGDVTSSALVSATGIKAGVKTGLVFLLNNFFRKKGGDS